MQLMKNKDILARYGNFKKINREVLRLLCQSRFHHGSTNILCPWNTQRHYYSLWSFPASIYKTQNTRDKSATAPSLFNLREMFYVLWRKRHQVFLAVSPGWAGTGSLAGWRRGTRIGISTLSQRPLRATARTGRRLNLGLTPTVI